MLKLFKFALAFLISLGERGEIGDEGAPDTGGESTDTTTVDTDTGSGGEGETGQPSQPADWRVERYGQDWETSLEYHRDTNKYLRGELDKAKRAQPRRGIEDGEQPPSAKATGGAADPYADVKSVPDVFKRVDQMLSEREMESNWRSSLREARERETGDPERGIPSFADLEQEQLIPFFQANPAVKDVIRAFPNPGQAMYTLAFLLKYPSVDKLRALFAGKARQEMGDRINEVSREAVRMRGSKDGATSPRLTPEQIRNMSSADFAKLEARNTGRRA